MPWDEAESTCPSSSARTRVGPSMLRTHQKPPVSSSPSANLNRGHSIREKKSPDQPEYIS